MLAHIGTATRIWDEIDRKRRLTALAGLNFQEMRDRFDAEESRPRSKAEIVELLRTEGEQFAAWLETLTPEFLGEMVTEPDGKTQKSRFDPLLSSKHTAMHPPAHLTLIEP